MFKVNNKNTRVIDCRFFLKNPGHAWVSNKLWHAFILFFKKYPTPTEYSFQPFCSLSFEVLEQFITHSKSSHH